ncbi:MAG: tetratricopeptide repeat protein [Cytophagaceae bacterium]|jgi:tetratricopeptide (TPR) repeat protein|nr:tetratricopeptide repeat protein [Cytophagaceae bacterium]
MKYLIFLLTFISITAAFACGNEYEVTFTSEGEEGNLYDVSYLGSHRLKHGFDTSSLQVRQKYLLEKFNKGEGDYKDSSDFALIEMKIGSLKTALTILEKLYPNYLNEYNIVTNLGTAYELAGKNELAFKFISKALQLNPNSHQGSEWIHLNILREKLKKKPDYKLIINLQVSDLRSGLGSYNSAKDLDTLFSIRDQLLYQLEERISFIAPEDAIVSQLLIDAGDLIAITASVELARDYYKMALQYNPKNQTIVEDRLKEINKVIIYSFAKHHWGKVLIIIIIFSILFLLIKKYKIHKTLAKNPKTLFLLDGFGALVSIFFLLFILATFDSWFNDILDMLSLIAMLYSIYSFSCVFFVRKSWPVFMQVIVVANILYCLLTAVIVMLYHRQLTELGILYFILEITLILGLAFIEQKTIQHIRKNRKQAS